LDLDGFDSLFEFVGAGEGHAVEGGGSGDEGEGDLFLDCVDYGIECRSEEDE
jgi:hypothetical protein